MKSEDTQLLAESLCRSLSRRKHDAALLMIAGKPRLVPEDDAQAMLDSGRVKHSALVGIYRHPVPAEWIADDLRYMAGK